jgi:hypothetical protein
MKNGYFFQKLLTVVHRIFMDKKEPRKIIFLGSNIRLKFY